MGRRAMDFEGSPGETIYNELLNFIGAKETIPSPYGFYEDIIKEQKKYQITRGSFTYWWMKLQIMGLVTVIPGTHCYKIKNVRVSVEDN